MYSFKMYDNFFKIKLFNLGTSDYIYVEHCWGKRSKSNIFLLVI